MQPHTILFFNWKDSKHPDSGGAEIVTHELMERLVQDGHKVTLLTARYKDSKEKDIINGVEIIRVGKSRLGHYFAAWWYYIHNLKNKFDIVVEEVNTLPYLTGLYRGNAQGFLFYHQLAREIWYHEMAEPLSSLGYWIVEPLLTRLQSKITPALITISESTKQDLIRYGFKSKQIKIISEGIENEPLNSLQDSLQKEEKFTVLFHSSLRKMKRPLEVLKAFHVLSLTHPESQLWFSGGGDQNELRSYISEHKLEDNVVFYGRTTDAQKFDLMQKAHVLCSTSLKEGWGLIVTEANSMGTPVIVYDVDGLRDAGAAGGGKVVKPDHVSMGHALLEVYNDVYNNPDTYLESRTQALTSSKTITFEQSYIDFSTIVFD